MRSILGYFGRLLMIIIGVIAVVLIVVGVVRFAQSRIGSKDKSDDKVTEVSTKDATDTNKKSDDSGANESKSDSVSKDSNEKEASGMFTDGATSEQSGNSESSDTKTSPSSTPNTNAVESYETTANNLPKTGPSMLSTNLFVVASAGLYVGYLKMKEQSQS